MARLVLLACLMLSAVSVSAAHNWLDVEHCSEGCTGHCGKKTRYITGKCVDNEGVPAGSYKATCTPGGAWKIEDYTKKGCTGASNPGLSSEHTCLPFPDVLPVKYVSYTKENNQVTVKICDKVSNTGDAADCDASGTCKEKTLTTNTNCQKVDDMNYYYTAKVTGDGDTATLTLGLYDDAKLCEAAVAPVFYKEGMAKDGCTTYKPAFKGTCTPMTRTHTVTQPTTTSTSSSTTQGTTSSSDSSTSSNDDGNNSNSDNDTDGNNTSSAVSSSLAAALLAVLAVLVALY